MMTEHDFQRMMLDRIESLEKRIAELDARTVGLIRMGPHHEAPEIDPRLIDSIKKAIEGRRPLKDRIREG